MVRGDAVPHDLVETHGLIHGDGCLVLLDRVAMQDLYGSATQGGGDGTRVKDSETAVCAQG